MLNYRGGHLSTPFFVMSISEEFTEKQLIIFALYYGLNYLQVTLTVTEIAAVLRVSPNTVKEHLDQCHLKLRHFNKEFVKSLGPQSC